MACLWACLAHTTLSLVISRRGPDEAAEGKVSMKKFMEKQKIKQYARHWGKKEWTKCGLKGDVRGLPKATVAMVDKVCGKDDHGYGDRCVCIISKAHSCHADCSRKHKPKPPCPELCNSQTCKAGDPENGGVPLSDGQTGKCFNFASPEYNFGPVPIRFCGTGYWYQIEGSVDCTGCNPKKEMPKGDISKKTKWTQCMANCYPSPSCLEMCREGSKACYTDCVARYTKSVEPFWDVFHNADTKVTDYEASKTHHDALKPPR